MLARRAPRPLRQLHLAAYTWICAFVESLISDYRPPQLERGIGVKLALLATSPPKQITKIKWPNVSNSQPIHRQLTNNYQSFWHLTAKQRDKQQPLNRQLIGGSLVGVWNGWGYGIAFFRALNFQISEPEI